MKIAITGANGFLGSHLVKTSLASGHETIALIRSGANLNQIPMNNKLVIKTIDYSSTLSINSSLEKLYAEIGSIDALIHNAGITVTAQKERYFEVNTELTRSLVKACTKSGLLSKAGKWIQVSSYAAHGPLNTTGPASSYGKSKLIAEQHLAESDFEVMIARPTAIYGPGDRAFLPLFKMAKLGIYPLLAPADQKITMIHAADLAEAILKQAGSANQNMINHYTDGNIYSHHDLRMALEHCTNKHLKVLKLPPKLVRNWLSFSDFLTPLIAKSPLMTKEKYEEISSNWNLEADTNLNHPDVSCHFDLYSGFNDTYQFYKSVNLL